MNRRPSHLAIGLALALAAACAAAEVRADGGGRYATQIEPTAGTWRTWVISSGKDYRAPAPPGFADTEAELNALAALVEPKRRSGPAEDRLLGRRRPVLPLDRPDQRAPPRRDGDDGLRAPRLRVRGAGHVRRDDRDLGVEVRLQPAAAERGEARPAHGFAGPEQPVLSVRARGHGAGGGVRARVFPAGGSGVVPVDGRGGRLVPRARRPPVPERLHGGPRPRPKSRRAGHREGEVGRLGRRLDGHACRPGRASGPGRTRATSRPRAGRPLLLTSASQFRPAGAAGVRLGRRCSRRSRRSRTTRGRS